MDGAKPDDRDPNRAIINDDTPALVNGPMKSHGQSTEPEIDVVLLHDNQTSSMASVMPQSTDNYEDPWPLPICSQPNFQWGSKDGKASFTIRCYRKGIYP